MTNHKEIVEDIIACGTSIVKNAESIVGTESTLSSLTVTIYIERDSAPRINIDRDFYPER